MTATPALNRATRNEYNRLNRNWTRALEAMRASTDPWDNTINAEEEAYTALCDFVEDNGLDGTALDPRGTWAEHDARTE